MALKKKEANGFQRRYTFKLYPSKAQANEMIRQCHMVGDLWNALLQRQEDTYRRWNQCHDGKKRLSFFDMTGEITQLRHECPEWSALSVWTAHRVARALEDAFQAFFKRAKSGAGASSGYPKFRSWRDHNWLPHRSASGFKMVQIQRDTSRQLDWNVTLKGVDGNMLAKGKFPSTPIAWNDVDIRLISGVWWLSVGVEMEGRREIGDRPRTVRFDLVDCFAQLDGADVPAWAAGITIDDDVPRIEALQRTMADQKRGSEEWRETKRLLGRTQAAVARRRKEALHVWTTSVVRSASRLIVIKPPSIKQMTESAKGDTIDWGADVETKSTINRTILAQAPALAIQMLEYKCKEAGIECVIEESHIRADDAIDGHRAIASVVKKSRTARVSAKKQKGKADEHRQL